MIVKPKDQNDRVVLITGASTGIGLSLTHKLKESPFRKVITARQESLSRFTKEGIQESESLIIRPLDVTKSTEIENIIQEIENEWGGVDILVNNAGVSYRSVTEHMTHEDELEQMQVNYFGPMHLIRQVLPLMRQKKQGHIINISSVGGMMAMPTMGAYSASKFALEGASEALWYEARLWGIRVNLIEPGFIHSDALKHVRWTDKSQHASLKSTEAYYPYYQHMGKMIEKMMQLSFATSDDVAAKIIRVMYQGHPALRIPATIDAWIFHLFRRLLPRSVYHYILFRSLPHIKRWVP